MKKKFLLVCLALMSLLGAKAQVPTTSTDANEYWYYIKTPRGPSVTAVYATAKADGSQVKEEDLVFSDAQLWKVVANTNGGIALVNKAYGTYMAETEEEGYIKTISAMPSIGLEFKTGVKIPNSVIVETVGTPKGSKPSFRVHAGETWTEWGLVNYPWDINDNCDLLFLTDKTLLENQITATENLLNTSVAGVDPGKFIPEAITQLQIALDIAKEIYNDANSTANDFRTSASDLDVMVKGFRSMIIVPEYSYAGNELWFYIQAARPANTYVTSTGPGKALANSPLTQDDTQLWKLVSNTNGTANGFALVNKATGEYIQTDGLTTGTQLVTGASMPTNNLKLVLGTESTNKIFRFYIQGADNTTDKIQFHATTTGPANHPFTTAYISWLFVNYNELQKTLFAANKVKARTIYDSTFEGSNFGQYSASVRTAFETAIIKAEDAIADEMPVDDVIAANTALETAIAAYVCNNDLNTLVAGNTVKWFRLINNATAEYANGKAMSSNGRVVDEKFTFETKDVASDAQLFRFVLNADNSKVANIVNKATGLYMGPNGAMIQTPATDAVTEFEIIAVDGQSFTIVPTGVNSLHAQQAGAEIMNYAAGAGSASAWRFEYVKEETTAVKFTSASNYKICSKNGILKIDGVTDFEVYSIDGQKQNSHSVLKCGVYFVKVNNCIQKVIVR